MTAETFSARIVNDGRFGLRLAIVLAISLHMLVIVALVLGSIFKFSASKPRMHSISVGLADPKMSTRAGKKTKAPVLRSSEQKPRKPKPKRATVKKSVKKADHQVGLNPEPNKPKPKPAAREEVPDDPVPPVEKERPTVLGGTGGSDEAGVAFELTSGQVDLDQNIEFVEYYRQVLREVGRRWSKGGFEGGTTAVTFEIYRDGSIHDVDVTKSSGKRFLDGPAERAVMGARLPPLPQGYRDQKLIFTINFRYGNSN